MPIITLSRELGSRGDDIAVTVAERLGLRLVGRELLNRAARQAGAPEVALAEIDELGLLGVKPTAKALRLYRETVEAIIRELADAGNLLLVGRGGQVTLADRPDVLNVRVSAPRERRVALVQTRCGVPAEVAAARVDASDRARAGYLRRHYGVRWDDPALYDLVLNTTRLGVEIAVEIICQAASHCEARRVGRSNPIHERDCFAQPARNDDGTDCFAQPARNDDGTDCFAQPARNDEGTDCFAQPARNDEVDAARMGCA